jgi:putative ubiquitin-RnfH superfamily antitoxin RatB of RatAB toxin-antitoxin module
MENDADMHIVLVFSAGSRQVHQVAINVATGSTVKFALIHSGLLSDCSPETMKTLELGVWGRKVLSSHPLRDGDRVEVYRPLLVDPKVARRERFVRQGAKGAGLFARRRDGAKAGY